jgi:Tat protein translocase TatB subunit
MFNLGGWEIALLVIFGLLFFGPNKLPQLMRQAGKIMHEIKKASNEFQYSIERELEDDEYKRQHRREKRRRRKLKEAGLDPDAPENRVPPTPTGDSAAAAANGNGATPNGNGGLAPEAPAAPEPPASETVPPTPAEAEKPKTGT